MVLALRDRQNWTVSSFLSDFGAGDAEPYDLLYIYLFSLLFAYNNVLLLSHMKRGISKLML